MATRVPSGLKGKRVRAHVYEWQIEVWYANQWIETLPRLTGSHHYHINYRHVIDSLLRKPGGFRNYRYRDDLFPQAGLPPGLGGPQRAFAAPKGRPDLPAHPQTSRTWDGVDMTQALTLLLEQNHPWDENTRARTAGSPASSGNIPELTPQAVNLSVYDQLLIREVCHVALEHLQQHLRTLRMPTAVEIVGDLLTTATRETWSIETFLSELLEQEMEGRHQRRTERLQKSSHLPAGKTLAVFDQENLPFRLRRQLAQLCTGEFVDPHRKLSRLWFTRAWENPLCGGRGAPTGASRAQCSLHPHLSSRGRPAARQTRFAPRKRTSPPR